MRSVVRFIAAISLSAGAACGGDPSGLEGPGGEYYLSAKVDGSAWSASSSTILTTGSTAIPGYITLQGSSGSGNVQTIGLQLGFIPGPGTYPLGVNQATTAGGTGVYAEGPRSWTTPFSGAAGIVTITELTSTRITGTFSFDGDAVGTTNPPLSHEVREGKFSVPLPAQFAVPTDDRRGSRVSSRIDGQPWNAATTAGTGGGQNIVIVSASNDDYLITISLAPPEQAGPQPLSSGFPARRVSVQRLGQNGASWGNNAGDEGTITVSSLTPTRIVGSFTGTLKPTIPGSTLPDLTVTEGTFDVRIAQ